MKQQLDLTVEGQNTEKMRKLLKDDPTVFCPEIFPAMTHPQVLTMDFIEDAVPVTEAVGGPLAKEIGNNGTKAVLRMILKENFVHGDLHPGNILWCKKNNKLAFIDNAIVIELENDVHSDI